MLLIRAARNAIRIGRVAARRRKHVALLDIGKVRHGRGLVLEKVRHGRQIARQVYPGLDQRRLQSALDPVNRLLKKVSRPPEEAEEWLVKPP